MVNKDTYLLSLFAVLVGIFFLSPVCSLAAPVPSVQSDRLQATGGPELQEGKCGG